jgi:uncharacterized protein YbbK (DUF523 family)/uncharacterized protein YbgA (DUF1722 family)
MQDTALIMGTTTEPDFPRIKLGVSACLLGEPIRYDGGHKRHSFLADILAAYVDYQPVCPEAGIGMGVPRPPIQLVGLPGRVRALGVENPAMDVTDRLEDYALQQYRVLTNISGYIFKNNSPSCGLGKVKLFTRANHNMQRKGTGVYASILIRTAPLLPVTEEDSVDNSQKCSHFLEQVYTFRRWQDLLASGITRELLLDFHTAHKYLIMAHSQAACHRLGKLLGALDKQPLREISDTYISSLMRTLKRPAQLCQHYNVLQHITNDLKQTLNPAEQSALTSRVEGYLAGTHDLASVAMAMHPLINRNLQSDSAAKLYLWPYPESLQRVIHSTAMY